MLSDAIRVLIESDPDVVAMVGSRVYPTPLPELAPYPAIDYFEVDTTPTFSMSGVTGLTRSRFQIDIWTSGKTDMRLLKRALVRLLNRNYKGGAIQGHDPFGAPFTCVLGGVLIERIGELYEPETKSQHGLIDVFVWNNENLET